MASRLVLHLQRATHCVGRYIERLADLGVTQGEAHVLAYLLGVGEASIAELHRAFAHKRSTLTSILDRLEGRGLARRSLHERDRRSFVVELTSAGVELAGRVDRHLEELEASVADCVSLSDIEGFSAVLSALESASEPSGSSD